jgi:DNA-binding transcriptional LysR family regulator
MWLHDDGQYPEQQLTKSHVPIRKQIACPHGAFPPADLPCGVSIRHIDCRGHHLASLTTGRHPTSQGAGSRGVAATALADSLAHEITGPLDTLSVTTQSFRSGASNLNATLYIGGPADCLSAKVIPALGALSNAGMRIRAEVGLTASLIERLSDGELDMVVATTPTRRRGVVLAPLFTETLVLVASAITASTCDRRQLAAGNPGALAHLPLVAFAENLPLIRRYWRAVFPGHTAPSAHVVLGDLRGIIATVVADGGVAVVPSYLARHELRTGSLVELVHPAAPPVNQLFLATRGSRPQPHVSTAAQHLRQIASTW